MTGTHTIEIQGARADVLGGCLMALGLFRVVATQVDPDARLWWSDDGRAMLRSRLDIDGLVTFLTREYQPTPVLSPWNAYGGFLRAPVKGKAGKKGSTPKDDAGADDADVAEAARGAESIAALLATTDPRLARFRETALEASRRMGALLVRDRSGARVPVAMPHVSGKTAVKGSKANVVLTMRAWLPDDSIRWLDAAVAVIGDHCHVSPLLGTGGNDGKQEFSRNYVDRLLSLFAANREDLARAALNGEPIPQDAKGVAMTVGMWFPAQAGSEDCGPWSNPWQFVLAVEGAMMYRSTTGRRIRTGTALFPFQFAASHGTVAASEANVSHEVWVPLLSRPTSLAEVETLFAAGRMDLSPGRGADSTTEAYRALATVGTQSGVGRFARFSVVARNGRSRITVYRGALPVARVVGAERLSEMVPLVDAAAAEKKNRAGRDTAASEHERTVERICVRKAPPTSALVTYGALLRETARCGSEAREKLPAVAPLSAGWATGDDSAEHAIAAALAGWSGFASTVLPLYPIVDAGSVVAWTWGDKCRWNHADPLRSIAEAALRRMQRADNGDVPLRSARGVGTDAIRAMLVGEVDPDKIDKTCCALAVTRALDVGDVGGETRRMTLPAAWAVLRAVTSPYYLRRKQDNGTWAHPSPADVTSIVNLTLTGRVDAALAVANRRLRAADMPPRAPVTRWVGQVDPRALAASLVVPMGRQVEADAIRAAIYWPVRQVQENDRDHAPGGGALRIATAP